MAAAQCAVGPKHFSMSNGATDDVRKHNELYNARNKLTKVTNCYPKLLIS